MKLLSALNSGLRFGEYGVEEPDTEPDPEADIKPDAEADGSANGPSSGLVLTSSSSSTTEGRRVPGSDDMMGVEE